LLSHAHGSNSEQFRVLPIALFALAPFREPLLLSTILGSFKQYPTDYLLDLKYRFAPCHTTKRHLQGDHVAASTAARPAAPQAILWIDREVVAPSSMDQTTSSPTLSALGHLRHTR
jgi:hypothetical protein